MDNKGYLDNLYVHKDYLNQGIATAICNELESYVNYKEITVYASITAKTFFEHRGYRLIKEKQIERVGICLKNYEMKKVIC